MIHCLVERNTEGQPIKVILPNIGGENNRNIHSTLFNKLLTLPFLDGDKALEGYQVTLTERFKEKFKYNPNIVNEQGEPKLFFITSSNYITDNYKDALNETQGGEIGVGYILTEDIVDTNNSELFKVLNNDFVVNTETSQAQYKINNRQVFETIYGLSSNKNNTTVQGLINKGISEGIISPERVLVDEQVVYKGAGQLQSNSILNSQLVAWEVISNIGRENIKVYTDGTFTIQEPIKGILVNTKGKQVEISKEQLSKDLESGKIEELSLKYDGIVDIAYTLAREKGELYQESIPTKTVEETELKSSMFSILNDLGVKSTYIDNYVDNYTIKNGKDITVKALADIGNNIVAFTRGDVKLEEVVEETSHFIVEAYHNQAAIEEVLPETRNTEEWKEFSEIYYEQYQERYKGHELDRMVEKEILGKILANKIKDNFNNQENSSLIDRILQIFNDFIATVKTFFTPSIHTKLDTVTEYIVEKIVNNEINSYLNSNNLEGNTGVYFSVQDKKALTKLMEVGQRLEQRINDLKRTKDTSSYAVQQSLTKLNDAINNNNEWYAVKTVMSAVDTQTKTLKKQLSHYRSNSEGSTTAYFTPEEQSSYTSLISDFAPLVKDLRSIMKEGIIVPEGVSKDKTINQMDKLLSEIAELEGDERWQRRRDTDAIVEKYKKQYGFGEKEEERFRQLLDKEQEDIGWFQSTFGSLEHASNAYLNILGKVINQNHNNANTNLLRDINPFLAKVQKENWKLKDFKEIIEQDEEGYTGYTMSPYMWSKYKKEETRAQVDAYNKIFNLKLTVEQYHKGLESAIKERVIKRRSEYTPEQVIQYDAHMSEWYAENTERRYLPEFYEKKKRIYEELGISKDTIDFLGNLSARRYTILAPYLKPGVRLDYKLDLNSRDREQISMLVKDRKDSKSVIDAETGDKKTGLALILAEDLKKLDGYYLEQNRKNYTVHSTFFDTIQRIEQEKGSGEAFEWLKVNGGIIFNDNFWDTFSKDKKGLIDTLKSLQIELSTQGDSEVDLDTLESNIPKMEILLERKTEILKQFQVANNPSEIDVDNMTGNTLQVLKETESELQDLFRGVNEVMRRNSESEVVDPTTIVTENTVNESYYKSLADSGKKELDFILDHVTERDSKNILEFQHNLQNIAEGKNFMTRVLQRFFENKTGQSDMTLEEIRDIINREGKESIISEYGKTRLLPYFKRFAPLGYDTFIKGLKEGDTSVSDFAKQVYNREQGTESLKGDITDLLSISTQFSWTDDVGSEESLNPNYFDNFEGGMRQPKIDKYINDTFFSKFNVDKEQYLQTGAVVSKGPNTQFNMLKYLWEIKRKGLEAYNETGSESIYKLPQVSKGIVERTKGVLSKNPFTTIQNSINDLIYNRVDELAYGERPLGDDTKNSSDIKIVPKYYMRDLEETTDISYELAYSYSLYLQASYMYKERLDTVSDAMVLQQNLIDQRYTNGKKGESTVANKMFNNFMDTYFYGIQRTRKAFVTLPNGKQIDISKLALLFDKMVRYVNIGFSLPIAVTAYTSAEIFLRIESIVGEYTTMNSSAWAAKEFTKLAPKMMSEVGKVNRESKLYQVMERFRLYDLVEKTHSSGFNKIIRSMNNLPYKFTEMATYPITPRVALSVLDNFRVVGDKFMDYNEFKEKGDVVNLTKKEIKSKWNAFREQSMYNLLESRNGVMEFKPEIVEKLGQEYLEQQLERIQGRIQAVNANVDAIVPQSDKSAATRDFLTKFMTAHRDWLFIAMQRRFKRRHFNFMTGQFEEGHYRTAGRLATGMFTMGEEKSIKGFIKAFKENYNKLEENEKRNLKRIVVDAGAYSAMLGLAILVAGFADDEDNRDLWAVQFASYVFFRTTNEMGSTQAPSGLFDLTNTIQSPFVAMNSVKQILDGKNWSTDEVTKGVYEGHSKTYRTIAKQTWLRHWYEMKDPKIKSDFFRMLNAETLITVSK